MGPLHGLQIIELASIGPGPLCTTFLADMGASVIKVDRPVDPAVPAAPRSAVLSRSRRSIAVDLRQPEGAEVVLRLAERADGLVEGLRPGVAERLGVGPAACRERNPRLVYGRMTGWGQSGPWASRAGHDIDYIALSGMLHAIGREGQRPVPPLNLVGDYGGGGLVLAFGMLCALWETQRSGLGQVVDAARVEGAGMLGARIYELFAIGLWQDRRGSNLLDGGAPFYDTYECKDGRYVAVGALEPQFYARLLDGLELDADELPDQYDESGWTQLRERFSRAFAARTRDEWEGIFGGEDACVAPVLSLAEAPAHPHNRARNAFVDVGGITQPAPAPRFERTVPDTPQEAPQPGTHTAEVLTEVGYDAHQIQDLQASGVVA